MKTTIVQALIDTTGLCRLSAIQESASKREGTPPGFAEDFDRKITKFGRTCDTHGYLDDPIILIEPANGRVIVACPFCSSPELLAAWETQAVAVGD